MNGQGVTLNGCRLLVHYGETRPSRFVWAGPLTSDITLDKLTQTFSAYGAVRNVTFVPGTRCNSCGLATRRRMGPDPVVAARHTASDYAVVEFQILQEAVQAKKHLNGRMIENCCLTLGYGKVRLASLFFSRLYSCVIF